MDEKKTMTRTTSTVIKTQATRQKAIKYDASHFNSQRSHMNDIVLIGDRFLTSLFKFVGVDTVEEPNDELAAKKVCDLVADEQYKIIMITENVAFKLTELRNNLLTTHRLYPIFVVVPGLEQTFGERENQLKQLVSQSLGIKLKFGD